MGSLDGFALLGLGDLAGLDGTEDLDTLFGTEGAKKQVRRSAREPRSTR